MELLTSRLVIVSVLNESGQSTQKQNAKVDHRRCLLRALRNKTQSTTVIRTSAATVGNVNRRNGIDPSEDDSTCQCQKRSFNRLVGDS